jgi:hypothetical protein
MYNPSVAEFNRYWSNGCMVVLDLVSQSPLSKDRPHAMTAEKLLVDIIADKTISATFSSSEVPLIYENMFGHYNVDRRRLNRYAGRRNRTAQVKKYLDEVK